MKTLRQNFQRFLAASGYCTPPGKAACALSSARTLAQWQQAEHAGLVRIEAEPEQESLRDVFGDEIAEREKEYVERWGVWWVYTEYFENGDWHMADSIGMCIYENPTDPFQNCYVVDLMRSALENIPQQGEH